MRLVQHVLHQSEVDGGEGVEQAAKLRGLLPWGCAAPSTQLTATATLPPIVETGPSGVGTWKGRPIRANRASNSVRRGNEAAAASPRATRTAAMPGMRTTSWNCPLPNRAPSRDTPGSSSAARSRR
ncbi:hypothetical protein [Nonomuraea dietziae]|uniref:hypothetical protein n=1 Tax=Nonomuraea dietziae TaxID=65515 RepID=UPI0033EA2E23